MNHVDARVDQLRHVFREAVVESALTIQSVMQEVRGQGQGMERLRHVLFNTAMDQLEGIDSRFQKCDKVVHQVVMKTDKQAHEMCTSIRRFIDEQGDIRSIVEELARRTDAIRDGTHPRGDALRDGTHPRGTSSDSNAPNEQNLPRSVLPCSWKSKI